MGRMDRDPKEGPGRRGVEAAPFTATTGSGHQALKRSWPTPSRRAIRWPRCAQSPCSGLTWPRSTRSLADDKEAPPKQRHTARRIFERLARRARLHRAATPRVQDGREAGQGVLQGSVRPRSPTHPATPSSTSARPWSRLKAFAPRLRSGSSPCPIRTPTSSPPIRASAPRPFRAAHVAAGFEFIGGVPPGATSL